MIDDIEIELDEPTGDISSFDRIDVNDNEVPIVNRIAKITITKSTVGLSDVDNTSDLDKPISTDAQEKFDSLDETIEEIEQDISDVKNDLSDVEDEVDGLLSDVSDIQSVIPQEASSQNQLADKEWVEENGGKVDDVRINSISKVVNKIVDLIYETSLGSDSNNTATVTAIRNFVNSSIESVAANYITSTSTGNAFATKSALSIGPYYYAGSLKTPTRNDYAVVIADETHDNKTARYIYTISEGATIGQWSFQYTFNMQFTQAQIDAINSGITSTKVALYDAHIINTNNPHSVTKTQIGLDNVINTGDSAIPIENGTTKFTTGGAYTELNKKQDKTDNSLQTTAKTIVGAINELNDKPSGPDTYIKSASKDIDEMVLTLTKQDDSTITFSPAITPVSDIEDLVI